MNTEKLQAVLQKSAANHSSLCPRQILGARMGLAGLAALGFNAPPDNKRLLIITETDGCFVDGLSAATGCTVGHRTLRVEDYGKTAAVFVDITRHKTLRLAPVLNIREKIGAYAPDEPRHYFAQMQAYQIMPDIEMFYITPVVLNTPIAEIISQPGSRVQCAACGEEVMNEREVKLNGRILCRACASGAYYQPFQASIGPTTSA
jgi:formylmethanofuran dehydrogenase subunit E